MARDLYINGEPLVSVKGASDTTLNTLSQLGLSAPDAVTLSPHFRHMDVNADAWGEAPFEIQWLLAWMDISMTLVHFDETILAAVVALSMGGEANFGQMARAGSRLGNNVAIGAAGNRYVSLYLSSPIEGTPWYFPATYLQQPPLIWPLGVRRSLVQLNFRAIPYITDPYNAGAGAANHVLWDNVTTT